MLSKRMGLVAQPSGARWHKEPTPLLGGVGIFIGIAISVFLSALFVRTFEMKFDVILQSRLLGLLLGVLIVFAAGLWDDISSLRPSAKLMVQIIAACIAIIYGTSIPLGSHKFFSILLTIFWIVAVTNAFNLIDNMDGLCSGIAAISGMVLAAWSFISGNVLMGVFSAALTGACLGFLCFNFPPASVFMGDCGSMVLGFSLAVASISLSASHPTSLAATLMVPVLVLGVPIFDTTFVSLTRIFRGQSIAQGGKDHTSHRLVILGVSERRAVLMIYAFSALMGITAFLYAYLQISIIFIIAVIFISGAVVFGFFLGEVKIDASELPAVLAERKNGPPTILNATLMHKRVIVEMLLDFVSICVAFYTATLFRYETNLSPARLDIFWTTLPVVILVQLTTFYFMGLYRSMWRYLGVADLIHITKTVTASSVLSTLAVLMIWGFTDRPRKIFAIDWLILLMLVSGTRMFFRNLRDMLPGASKKFGKRILIMGAGDAGEMLVREMLNNPRLGYQPVGFLDDNPGKSGKRMYGVSVMGTRSDFLRIAVEENIEEVIVAIPSVTDEMLSDFFAQCETLQLPCRRMHTLI
ncbi:MAG: hypothetical protein O2807_10355 [bacterium]|nr:hypothetical protein [bacterium]